MLSKGDIVLFKEKSAEMLTGKVKKNTASQHNSGNKSISEHENENALDQDQDQDMDVNKARQFIDTSSNQEGNSSIVKESQYRAKSLEYDSELAYNKIKPQYADKGTD